MRHKTLSAIFVILIKDNHILLQKRQNTGYADGMYDLAVSGHVEENESLKETVIRESLEEIGIIVTKKDIDFVTLIHKNDLKTGHIYYNIFFEIRNYRGEPLIKEPEKCSELKWFRLDELPVNLIEDRKTAISNFLNKEYYTEQGWEE